METGELAVMVAATSDPEFKTRLAALREAMAEQDTREQALREIGEHNAELLAQAREEHAAAEAKLTEAEAMRQQHVEDTAALASAQQSYNEELGRFAEVRKTIEDGHAAKDAELTVRETAVEKREAAVEAGHADQTDREQRLMRGEQQIEAAREFAQKFIDTFNGPVA